jgi:hypothetical protein
MERTPETFRLQSGSYDIVHRKNAVRSIFVLLLMLIPIVGIIYQNNPEMMEDYLAFSISFWAILVGIVIFKISRKNQQISEVYYSYELTIDPRCISRSSSNVPTVSIDLNQVKSIQQYSWGYKIMATNSKDVIYVPDYIENKHRVEELLRSIGPITPAARWMIIQRLYPFFALIPIGLFCGMLVTHNKLVVGVTAPLFIGAMIWGWILARKSKNSQFKRGNWFFIIMIAVTIWYMVQVFSGNI